MRELCLVKKKHSCFDSDKGKHSKYQAASLPDMVVKLKSSDNLANFFQITFAGYNSVVLKDKVLQYVELIHIKISPGRAVTNVIGFASLILTTFHDICLKMLLNFNLM